MTAPLPSSYAEYLVSPWWQQRRLRSLHLAFNRCQSPICADAWVRSLTDEELAATTRHYRLEVHHLTYERLGRELDDDLIVLCQNCHLREHGLPLSRTHLSGPISLAEALENALNQMAKSWKG